MLNAVAAGAIAGLLANVTGYLITGRFFHRFQARTPNTWRRNESWTQYLYASSVRIVACIAVALLYVVFRSVSPSCGDGPIAHGFAFGLLLWAATILPVVLEISLFVNWHSGFLVGLLLDWLVLCVLASTAAALAARFV